MSKVTRFSDILLQVSRSRRALNDHRKRTFEWYRQSAKRIRQIAKNVDKADVGTGEEFIRDNKKALKRRKTLAEAMIGQMIMFVYDPKTKAKLPYYDTFPLVFPIKLYEDGWLGINLHYLPPNARAVLMGNLYNTLTSGKDDTKKLAISYELLKSASRYQLFQPCIKRYLYSHVRSKFLFVDPKEWDAALMLPTAQFQKASETKVWQDSMESIK